MDCSVCCETFKCDSPKMITCSNRECDFKACRSCNQTYLQSKEAMEPHCMDCKASWNQYFVVTKLTRTWFDKVYTPIRNRVVVETEMSKLPESMPRAIALKRELELRSNQKAIMKVYLTTNKLLETERRSTNDQGKIAELTNQLKEIRKTLDEAAELVWMVWISSTPSEKKKFVMACVFGDCKGFLNQDYFCEICNRTTCKHCLCGIEGEHECNKEDKETADEIKKTTRPCPTCGERIFKISGCDQMYCTQCYTAFSWKTGNVETGNIHNPHFFQIRRANNGVVPRNPNDVLCGGMPDYDAFNSDLCKTSSAMIKHYQNPENYTTREKDWRDDMCLKTCSRLVLHTLQMSSIQQAIGHITGVDLPRHRRESRDLASCEDLRVLYLTDQMNKAEFDSNVAKRHMMKRKTDELLNLYELISVMGIEFIRDVYESTFEFRTVSHSIIDTYFKLMSRKIDAFYEMVMYVNTQFQIVSIAYNCRVLRITLPSSSPCNDVEPKTNFQRNFRLFKRKVTREWSVMEPIDWSDYKQSNASIYTNIMDYRSHRNTPGNLYENILTYKMGYGSYKATMKELKNVEV